MFSLRIQNVRFRILKGGKIGLAASLALFGSIFNTAYASTTIDGNSGGGYFVSEARTISDSIYTNFFTQGGIGSGGGAGLGGVFFVDKTGSLSLTNVSFSSNATKGGEGGTPAQVFVGAIDIALQERSSSISSYQEMLITPTLTKTGDIYSISSILLNGSQTSFKEGSTIVIDGISTSGKIDTIAPSITNDTSSNKTVDLVNDIAVSSNLIVRNTTTTLQTINNSSISTITIPASGDLSELATNSNINVGALFAYTKTVNGAATTSFEKIASVVRSTSGNVTSFTLENAINTAADSNAAASKFDIINIQSAKASDFSVDSSNNQVTFANSVTGYGLTKGMTLTGDGIKNANIKQCHQYECNDSEF